MRDWPVHVIPHPLDLSVFKPIDRALCREVLNLPVDDSIVVFGAIGGTKDPNKGFDLLLPALAQASRQHGGRLLGVIFGEGRPRVPSRTSVRLHWLGRIHDDVTLSLIYNAADVVVVPSRQEAFGLTAAEAQACGTPVVAFNVGGLAEAISHRETGYLADAYSVSDLARGISSILQSQAADGSLGRQARQRALTLWDPGVVAKQYLRVYKSASGDTY